MHGPGIAGAIAAVTASIADALLDGRPTAELRRELAMLEQRQRREAAAAAAAERQARAAAEAEEEAAIHASAAELVAAAEDRLRRLLAPLELPASPVIRRTPTGLQLIED